MMRDMTEDKNDGDILQETETALPEAIDLKYPGFKVFAKAGRRNFFAKGIKQFP